MTSARLSESRTAVKRPRFNTWTYRIYIDLVINQRLRCSGFLKEKRRRMFSRIAQERGVDRCVVRAIYDRFVRPQLHAGVKIEDLR
jgi:hypothetical protein